VSHSGSGGGTVAKGGGDWQIGLGADVAWITNSTETGLSITSAIPPIFDAYATIVMPEPGVPALLAEHELRVLRLLMAETADQDWWLGYLDTGTDDVVFPDAPRVLLYAHWGYVVVKAGPAQAQLWRTAGSTPRHTRLPDLMFPRTGRGSCRPCGTTTGGVLAGRAALLTPSWPIPVLLRHA